MITEFNEINQKQTDEMKADTAVCRYGLVRGSRSDPPCARRPSLPPLQPESCTLTSLLSSRAFRTGSGPGPRRQQLGEQIRCHAAVAPTEGQPTRQQTSKLFEGTNFTKESCVFHFTSSFHCADRKRLPYKTNKLP